MTDLTASELTDEELELSARIEITAVGILPDAMLGRPIHRHMMAEGIEL